MQKLKPGNIYSGTPGGLAALTNPTGLAREKGALDESFPVTFRGQAYVDAETAYQETKRKSSWLSWNERETLCTEVIVAKLSQHPQLMDCIAESGGVSFLEQCCHFVGRKRYACNPWEGCGRESMFIRCLIVAYENVRGV